MNQKLTQYIVETGELSLALQAIRERRDEILDAIAENHLVATDDVVAELAELNIALGDVTAEEGDHGS